MRTIAEHVRLDVGPYAVEGYLHRSPSSHPLNALNRWSRFIPVNRDRIRNYHVLHDAGPAWSPTVPEDEAQPEAAQPAS